MPARPFTPAQRELRTARKTLARIQALDPAIDPKWHRGMLDHWEDRVRYLEAVVRHERSAH